MCCSCGCGDEMDDHSDGRNITTSTIVRAAEAAHLDIRAVAQNLITCLRGWTTSGRDANAYTESLPVIKSVPEQRYVLGVAYQAGPDDAIKVGADGRRDYFQAETLEKTAWDFLRSNPSVGLFHADGTLGHAEVVESYVYRGPDWCLTATDGSTQVVKAGAWLVGAILDPVAWDLFKAGRIDGWSPQGKARRRSGSSS